MMIYRSVTSTRSCWPLLRPIVGPRIRRHVHTETRVWRPPCLPFQGRGAWVSPPPAASSSFNPAGGSDGPGGSLDAPNTAFERFKEVALRWIRRIALACLSLTACAAVMLGAAPSLLSHPSGLQTVTSLFNSLAPCTLHVESISAGWNKPIDIRNVKIEEKRRDFASTHHLQEQPTANQERPSAPSEQPTRALVTIDRIRSPSTLFSLLKEGGDVLVTRPKFDATFNHLGNLRLAQLLQDAGLSPPPWGKLQGAASEPQQAVSEALQEVGSEVVFAGEVRKENIRVALSDGTLMTPALEFSPAPLYFEVLMGAPTIDEEAATAGQPSAFPEQEPPSSPEWTRQRPAVQLPPGVGTLTTPVAVRVDSPEVRCSLAGWSTSRGFTYLVQPVEAQLTLTPEMFRLLLSRLNPLLGSAVEVQGSSTFAAQLSPQDSIWPAAAATLRLEPLRVRVGKGAAVSRALEVLEICNPRVARAAEDAALQVDLSPISAEIHADGTILADRADLHVGVTGLSAPLHFVSWGSAHASGRGSIAMVLAIPSDTLALLGINGLPPDFGVPVNVTGTSEKPKIEVWRASKEVAMLVLEQKAKQLGSAWSPEWMQEELRLGQESGRGARFRVPRERKTG